MSIRVKNNIHWVGKIDWELRKFHGDEYSTHRGSTYNSYLIKKALSWLMMALKQCGIRIGKASTNALNMGSCLLVK